MRTLANFATNISPGPSNEVNDAPTCEDLALRTREDSDASASPRCSDVECDTLTYSIAAQPDHGSVSLVDGRLTYEGTDSFAYEASDGRKLSDEATVSVEVVPVNDRPTLRVARAGSCGTDQRSGTIVVGVSDVEDPTSALGLSASSSNRALVPDANISFSGSGQMRTMTLRALDGKSGTATIEVTLSDGELKSTEIVRVEVGTNGADTVTGTKSTDVLFGLGGADVLGALGGADLLCSGDGVDVVEGSGGDDALFGGAGGDVLRGGKGDDRISGGGGEDQLYGEAGADRMSGGSGADRFGGGPGTDTATDFTPSQGDTKDNTIP
jgi:hypothetical protein